MLWLLPSEKKSVENQQACHCLRARARVHTAPIHVLFLYLPCSRPLFNALTVDRPTPPAYKDMLPSANGKHSTTHHRLHLLSRKSLMNVALYGKYYPHPAGEECDTLHVGHFKRI